MKSVKELIESVMIWNEYPHHESPWSGWEYVPKSKKDKEFLSKLVGIQDFCGDCPEFICLQVVSEGLYKVGTDHAVWELSEKEFVNILNALDIEKDK